MDRRVLLAAVSSWSIAVFAISCGGAPAAKPAAPPSGQSMFVATEVKGLGDPEIVVENHSAVSLTLEVKDGKGGTLQVAPGTTLTMKVSGGAHPFVASAPDAAVKSLEGVETFAVDHRYKWVFTVVSGDPDEGKGWFCYDTGDPIVFCERTEVACIARREKDQKGGAKPPTACAALATPWTFADMDKKLEWFTIDEAACKKAAEGYRTEMKPSASALTSCRAHP